MKKRWTKLVAIILCICFLAIPINNTTAYASTQTFTVTGKLIVPEWIPIDSPVNVTVFAAKQELNAGPVTTIIVEQTITVTNNGTYDYSLQVPYLEENEVYYFGHKIEDWDRYKMVPYKAWGYYQYNENNENPVKSKAFPDATPFTENKTEGYDEINLIMRARYDLPYEDEGNGSISGNLILPEGNVAPTGGLKVFIEVIKRVANSTPFEEPVTGIEILIPEGQNSSPYRINVPDSYDGWVYTIRYLIDDVETNQYEISSFYSGAISSVGFPEAMQLYVYDNSDIENIDLYIMSNGLNNDVENESESDKLYIAEWAQEHYDKGEEYNLITEALLGHNSDELITREQYAELVVKLYESLSGEEVEVPDVNPFHDTDNPEVLKAHKLGIVYGRGEGEFDPYTNITRQELACLYYRVIGLLNPSIVEEIFTPDIFDDDENISHWAKDCVYFFREYNIIYGTGENLFEPLNTATFAEAMVLAVRVYESEIVVNTSDQGSSIDQDTSDNSDMVFNQIFDSGHGTLNLEGVYFTSTFDWGTEIYYPISGYIFLTVELTYKDGEDIFIQTEDAIDMYIQHENIIEYPELSFSTSSYNGICHVIFPIPLNEMDIDVWELHWNDFSTYIRVE